MYELFGFKNLGTVFVVYQVAYVMLKRGRAKLYKIELNSLHPVLS